MADPIAKADLERARRRFKKQLAAAILAAMAEANVEFADINAKLGNTLAKGWLDALVNGTAINMDIVSDMATAMGYDVGSRVYQMMVPQPEVTSPVVSG